MKHRDHTHRNIANIARKGLAIAALFVCSTVAAATWLAGPRAEASPSIREHVQTSPPTYPAEIAPTPTSDRTLTKNGKVLTGKLNINTATTNELQMLPGIGPKKAQRVVDYRTRRGKFKRVRDLRRVKGFGYKTVQKLSPYLSVQGKSTLQTE